MDIDKFINNVRFKPETYKTALCERYNNPTALRIMRRKVNKGISYGEIYRTKIPYSTNNKYVYYSSDKDYFLFFINTNIGCDVYYTKEYSDSENIIVLKDAYLLINNVWKHIKEKIINKNNIIKVI